ncbi:AIPR family protein [Rhizobium sp. NZLR1b]|uniref:AIPR family protein n=1 Tax=Rhizobium sp. NZLR1b TaxID=2731099 RepID=UPI001C8297C6|nr:AIPR family protein [Rhizobium sp. NZLR1b]MBX5171395.1 AIPR family protein [Rhizobium sp. NZLR1b]
MANEIKEIFASVDELALRGRLTRNRAFAAWFAITFHNIDEDEALEAAASDGGNDQGIDLVFADVNSEEIVVIQAHCPENLEKKTPKAKWDAVPASIPFVAEPSLLIKVGRPDLSETISSLKEAYPEYMTSAGLVSLGLRSQEIVDSVAAHDNGGGPDLGFFYLAQEDLIARYKALVSSEQGIPEDTLAFSGGYFEDQGDYGRAWIGSVSATELQRLHKAHSDELFAGNIRLFLGSRKGGINEQIIKTAKEAPGSFWALNNGVTIVADSAEPTAGADGSKILKLRRFSIVNGCQTTSSLVQAKANDKARVLARVIAAKATLRTDIVRYNNSQNAVRIWSVRAADDLQKILRAEFKAVAIDYAPKQEGSRRKKDPSTIELDKVTQYLASTENEYLIQAIANKGELFDQPYQKLFYKGIKAPNVYISWLIGGAADAERQNLLNGLNGDPNGGLLGVTSSYWIVYCTYKMLLKFTNIESPHFTLARMQSRDFQAALKKYVTKATDIFYDAAVDTYDRDEYGSFKSTLRSSKFLQKMDGKLNARIARLAPKTVPDLVAVAKSVKV